MVNDLKDFLKERIKNPFLAALCFFWFAFNWKILAYILFSSDSIELKIDCYRYYYDWLNFYAYPFLTAILYVLLSTFVFAGIEWVSVKGFLFRRKIFYKKLAGDINAQKDVELAKFNREQARSGYEKQKELNDRIESLSSDLKKEKNNVAAIEKSKSQIENRLTLIKNQINYDFQFDLRDDKVKQFLEGSSKDEIEQYGSSIYHLSNMIGRDVSEDDSNLAIILEKQIGVGFFNIDSSGVLLNVELSSIGKYLLRRHLYSSGKLADEKFEFVKRDYKFL